MDIIYYHSKELNKHSDYLNDILNLLIEGNNEFLPPLSLRTSIKDVVFNKEDLDVNKEISFAYYKNVIKNQNLLAVENHKVIGFMSFLYNYDLSKIIDTLQYQSNIYISTVYIKQSERRKGITNSFYNYIESNNINKVDYITTRTWSTNYAHIGLLDKREYSNIFTIKNNRILNKNEKVDTIYFAKCLK